MGAVHVVGAILLLSIPIVGVFGVVNYYASYYPEHVYPVNQVKGWVDIAAETSDMQGCMYDMNNSISTMENHSLHGNPNWIFGTPQTNYDNIRVQIEYYVQQAMTIRHELATGFFNSSFGSTTYTAQVAQLWANLNAVSDRLQSAADAQAFQPIAAAEALYFVFAGLTGLVCVFSRE